MRRHKMSSFSLLFSCIVLFLVFEGANSFTGMFGTAHDVLGANLRTDIDPKTGFISGHVSRLNAYQEASSVSFHFKPHEHKLKLLLEEVHSCFDVRCRGSQVLMKSKFKSHNNLGCINAGVGSLSSSSHTTGRLLRYDLQRRPSLDDLRSGDFLYSNLACSLGESQTRVIDSIDRLSDNEKESKSTIFVINTREATLVDAFSSGTYEFRTQNILTVNDVARSPKFATRSDDDGNSFRKRLIDLVRLHAWLAHDQPFVHASKQSLFNNVITCTCFRNGIMMKGLRRPRSRLTSTVQAASQKKRRRRQATKFLSTVKTVFPS
jgi:hypothetical protein